MKLNWIFLIGIYSAMHRVRQKRWKRSNAYWKGEKKGPIDKRWLSSQKLKPYTP